MEILIGLCVFNLVCFYIASLMMLYEDYGQIRIKDLFLPIRGYHSTGDPFLTLLFATVCYIVSPALLIALSLGMFIRSDFGNKVVFERKVEDSDD